MRAPTGEIITFDAPGAGATAPEGTNAQSINQAGAVAGFYMDASNDLHGYVRDPSGAITSFDAADGVQTQAVGINAAGTIIGTCFEKVIGGVHSGTRSFVRSAAGDIRIFRAPNAYDLTYAVGINAAGVIAGLADLKGTNLSEGFLLSQ